MVLGCSVDCPPDGRLLNPVDYAGSTAFALGHLSNTAPGSLTSFDTPIRSTELGASGKYSISKSSQDACPRIQDVVLSKRSSVNEIETFPVLVKIVGVYFKFR